MAFLAAIPAAIGSVFTGGGLSTLFQIGGAAISGISALQAGSYQAAVAKNNALIAEENAAKASEAAQRNQISSDQEMAAFVGQQEAIQSASGLNSGGRSQVLTRRRTRSIGRTDAMNIIDAGQAEVRGYQQQAANFRAEAREAKRGGMASALGEVLGVSASLVGSSSPTRSKTANRYRTNRTWRTA